jgi:hypothetical protein
LKAEPSFGRADDRPHGIVAHRQNRRRHAERAGELSGDVGQRSAVAQRMRTHEVRGQVAITEREPRRRAVRGHR